MLVVTDFDHADFNLKKKNLKFKNRVRIEVVAKVVAENYWWIRRGPPALAFVSFVGRLCQN